jgi:hypothetical protein
MWEILNVLRRLGRGESKTAIAAATGHSRSTIRRYEPEALSLGWTPRTEEPTEELAADVGRSLSPARARLQAIPNPICSPTSSRSGSGLRQRPARSGDCGSPKCTSSSAPRPVGRSRAPAPTYRTLRRRSYRRSAWRPPEREPRHPSPPSGRARPAHRVGGEPKRRGRGLRRPDLLREAARCRAPRHRHHRT